MRIIYFNLLLHLYSLQFFFPRKSSQATASCYNLPANILECVEIYFTYHLCYLRFLLENNNNIYLLAFCLFG